MTLKGDKPVYHYVYKIDDRHTGHFYFGKRTSNLPPNDDPYMGSGRWVQKHEIEFGRYLRDAPEGRFVKHILQLCSNGKSLRQHEADAIQIYSYNNDCCQNIQNSYRPTELTSKQIRIKLRNAANATFEITSIETGMEYCAKRKELSSIYGIKPPEVAPFLAGRIAVANGFCLSKNAQRLRATVSGSRVAERSASVRSDTRGQVSSPITPKPPEPFIIRHKTMAEKLAGFR